MNVSTSGAAGHAPRLHSARTAACYLAELYLPRLRTSDLTAATERARTTAVDVRFLRSIFVPDDETLFLLYQGHPATAVKDALTRCALRYDRILEAVTEP